MKNLTLWLMWFVGLLYAAYLISQWIGYQLNPNGLWSFYG